MYCNIATLLELLIFQKRLSIMLACVMTMVKPSSILQVRLGIVAELTNPFVRSRVLEMLILQVDFSFVFVFVIVFVFDQPFCERQGDGDARSSGGFLFLYRFRCICKTMITVDISLSGWSSLNYLNCFQGFSDARAKDRGYR